MPGKVGNPTRRRPFVIQEKDGDAVCGEHGQGETPQRAVGVHPAMVAEVQHFGGGAPGGFCLAREHQPVRTHRNQDRFNVIGKHVVAAGKERESFCGLCERDAGAGTQAERELRGRSGGGKKSENIVGHVIGEIDLIDLVLEADDILARRDCLNLRIAAHSGACGDNVFFSLLIGVAQRELH